MNDLRGFKELKRIDGLKVMTADRAVEIYRYSDYTISLDLSEVLRTFWSFTPFANGLLSRVLVQFKVALKLEDPHLTLRGTCCSLWSSLFRIFQSSNRNEFHRNEVCLTNRADIFNTTGVYLEMWSE